jgi:MtaA/CmuA family methyltransferase
MSNLSLSSRERVLRTLDHQPTDVIPVAPFMFDLAAVHYGISVGKFATDGRAMARAQLALHEELGQDVIFIGSDNYYIAEGFGCEAGIPDDEIPHLEVPALKSLADVYSLEVPDPLTDGRMPVMLEATRRVKEAVGDAVAIRTPGTGPFALASYFIGTQDFLVEVGLAEAGLPEAQPEAIHHALDLAAEALIAFGQACFDAGSDILHCGDSLASCDMISPGQYEKYAFPYQKKVIEAWQAYGARTLLHICGDSTKVLHLYADTGADIVEIDHKVDLAMAKQAIGDKTCLLGNVDTVSALLLGTPDLVRHDAEACISAAAANGRYMLGSGCMVPRTTPLENVKTMVEVARAHPNDFWAN